MKEPIIIENGNLISIQYDDRKVIISVKHAIYKNDIIYDFETYFNSVEYELIDGIKTVDFSKQNVYKAKNFPDFPLMFSGFPESSGDVVEHYCRFGEIEENSIVLDLGAYAGLSSITFDKQICKNNKNAEGKVIAIEADPSNKSCLDFNFNSYEKKYGRKIEHAICAVWNKDGELNFSSESNMGASAVSIVGESRGGTIEKVPCYKLSSLAKKFKLKKIDFVKCDIEGGEIEIFKDWKFFAKYNPKILIESHYLYSREHTTVPICKKYLSIYGYTFKEISQNNDLYTPVIECYPDKNRKMYLTFLCYLKAKIKFFFEKDNTPVNMNYKPTPPTFLQKVFSLRNEGKHKVLRVFGIKLKFKRGK